ncbi:MAG: hypothetical protein ACPGJR_10790 [Akkermansiaceae bacterium]
MPLSTVFADVDFESARKIADNLKAFPKALRLIGFREMYDEVGRDFDTLTEWRRVLSDVDLIITPTCTTLTSSPGSANDSIRGV